MEESEGICIWEVGGGNKEALSLNCCLKAPKSSLQMLAVTQSIASKDEVLTEQQGKQTPSALGLGRGWSQAVLVPGQQDRPSSITRVGVNLLKKITIQVTQPISHQQKSSGQLQSYPTFLPQGKGITIPLL